MQIWPVVQKQPNCNQTQQLSEPMCSQYNSGIQQRHNVARGNEPMPCGLRTQPRHGG